MARIILTEDGRERAVDIVQPVIEIGRGQDNAIVIADPRSSRKHCRVSRTPQGWVLEDLKSRNGTLMNGAAVERIFLKHGDEFRIGKTVFRFEDAIDAPPGDETATPVRAESAPPAAVPAAADEAPPRDALEDEDLVLQAPPRDEPGAAGAVQAGAAAGIEGLFLEGTEGKHAGQRIAIERVPFTIGRKKGNDFAIDDPRASGEHARIVRRADGWWIEDLDSRNGTIVNHRRVNEGELTHEGTIRVGDCVFRVELPPADRRAVAVAVPGAGDVEPAPEDSFPRFDAREFMKGGDGSGSPLAVAMLLLVLGTLLYFAVDITLKKVRPHDPDPSPAGNSLANWSFEDRREGAGIPGWSAWEGSDAALTLSREGAQYPGENALRLAAAGPGLARAASADIPVAPGRHYRVTAHVLDLGAFAAGVCISWLAEGRGQRVEVGRDWGAAMREEVKEGDIDRVVSPPPSAAFARVCPFVIASTGSGEAAAFDKVFFGPASEKEEDEASPPADSEVEVAEGSDDEPALPVEMQNAAPSGAVPGGAPQGVPIRLVVAEDGALANLRRGRPILSPVWTGLAAHADPLAIGTRKLVRPRDVSEREGVLLGAQIPDTAKGSWLPLEARVQAQGGDIRCDFRVGRSKSREAGGADRAAIYLEVAPGMKEVSAFGGTLKTPVAFEPDKPEAVAGTIDELVFGNGAEQMAIVFRPQVTLRAIDHPDIQGRKLLVAETPLVPDPAVAGEGGGNFVVRISPFSRREEEAAAALLKDAGELHGAGKAGDARARLEELRKRFPWRADAIARADDLEKSWAAEAESTLKSIAAGVEDLRMTPVPVIRDALLARIAAARSRFEGMPAERALDDAAGVVRKLVPDEKAPVDAPRTTFLQEARTHLDRGEVGVAELFLRLARGLAGDAKLSDEDDASAKHLEGLIAERRKQRAAGEVK